MRSRFIGIILFGSGPRFTKPAVQSKSIEYDKIQRWLSHVPFCKCRAFLLEITTDVLPHVFMRLSFATCDQVIIGWDESTFFEIRGESTMINTGGDEVNT